MSEKSYRPPSFFFPAILLGAGIALGFTLLGTFVYRSVHFFKTEDRCIKVRGLAEEIVKSDVAVLSFNICTFGETPQSVYKLSKTQVQETMDLLLQSGYTPSEIRVSQGSVTDREINKYGHQDSKQIISKDKRCYSDTFFKITTKKVDELKLLNESVNSLTEKGITIADKYLNYIYSDFLSKRPELLKKAALDAQSAAVQVSKEMNVPLGDLQNIHQGLVEILSGEPGSSEHESSHGRALYKKLRVIFQTTWGIRSSDTVD